ncbi:N-acetylmuramoyl-L-alanine amidase [Streptomyces sp. NPDC057375]|uniref:peptidoglycan recognition protein family protein n=1 Tax=Streptomyces sp. NPDC057375 TaxID=3346109 RepID=UPI00362CDB8B
MAASRLIRRSQWGARSPKAVSHDFTPWRGGVAIHHTGGKPNLIGGHSECYSAVRGIQNYHMNGEYDDIAYSYAACKHGYLFEGRGIGIRTGANGTNSANDNYYAILGLVGGRVLAGAPDLYDSITHEMLDAIRFGVSLVRSTGSAGGEITGHRNLFSTECPGKLYNYVANGSLEPGTPTTWPPTQPDYDPDDTGTAPDYLGALLHYPPIMQHPSAAVWQRRMLQRGWSIVADGFYGPQSRRVCIAFQQEKGLAVDGVVGPQTWYATWNAPITGGSGDTSVDYLGRAPDWSGVLFTYPPYTTHSSVRTWQQRMRDRGWTIDVDGVYGAGSRKVCVAFQQEKGLLADGIVGPTTWQAAWTIPVT